MQKPLKKWLSWILGIGIFTGLAAYAGPRDVVEQFSRIGGRELVGWILVTLTARLLLVETTVLPLKALGFYLPRRDAFWISWIRTFFNLIMPLSGIAAFAKFLRTRIGISWSEIAALAAPQFVLALAALGLVGALATSLNLNILNKSAAIFGTFFVSLMLVAIFMALSAGRLIGFLPENLSIRLAKISEALRQLASLPGLIVRLVLFHAAAITLRGCRIWFLFGAAGISLEWSEMLLLLAVAESNTIINLTPGGLGVRETLLMGGALLLGIPPPIAASVAIIDRLLVFIVATSFALPATLILREKAANNR